MSSVELRGDVERIRFGKVLQIFVDDCPYLVIGNHELLHNQILEEYLKEKEIQFEARNLNGPNFGPVAEGKRYRLVGAGWANLYTDNIELWGDSGSYRMSPSQEHAEKINETNPQKHIRLRKVEHAFIETNPAEHTRVSDDEVPF